jgi:hypothetical protein
LFLGNEQSDASFGLPVLSDPIQRLVIADDVFGLVALAAEPHPPTGCRDKHL